MIEAGKPVESEHPQGWRQRAKQDCEFEAHHRKRRPGIDRASADVDRIIPVGERLHGKREHRAKTRTKKPEPVHLMTGSVTKDAGQFLDRKWRKGIEIAVAFAAHLSRGCHQRFGCLELGQRTVKISHAPSPPARRAALPWSRKSRSPGI